MVTPRQARGKYRQKPRPPLRFDDAMALIQGRAAHDDLTLGALRQLIVLSLLSQDQAWIDAPNFAYLAEATNRSPRSAQADMAQLIALGYVEQHKINYQHRLIHLLKPGE
jgi:hypothetical protein